MSDRLHIVSIRFEDGRMATVTLRDKGNAPSILHIEGLNHVVKTSLESYSIQPASETNPRLAYTLTGKTSSR